MELYLDNCLSSLILDDEQMSLLEIIIVNDGSKDNSIRIAMNYAQRFPDTFVVIDKENGNYGSCVNVGLHKATGRYFRILDADDSYQTAEFSSFVSSLDKLDVDLVITPFVMKESDGMKEMNLSESISLGREYTIDELSESDFLLHMHSMTFATSMLKESKLILSEGVSYSDTEFCFFPLQHVRKIAFLGNMVYLYNACREGQTMSIASQIRSTYSMNVVANRLLDYFCENRNVSNTISSLWKRLIIRISEIYYRTALLYCKKSDEISEPLRLFDKKIQLTTELDEYLSQLCVHHIHFVAMWRRNGRFYSSRACQIHDIIWDKLDPIWLAYLRKYHPSRL